jgi:hypothetical protein
MTMSKLTESRQFNVTDFCGGHRSPLENICFVLCDGSIRLIDLTKIFFSFYDNCAEWRPSGEIDWEFEHLTAFLMRLNMEVMMDYRPQTMMTITLGIISGTTHMPEQTPCWQTITTVETGTMVSAEQPM